jgi:hypothetical protein
MHTQHGFGHAAWIWTVDMHKCMNAGMPIKKLSLALLVFR